TSLTDGNWTPVSGLAFSSPNTATTGALNGNDPANRAIVTGTITGLNVATGQRFWIRWIDADASGSDDGLAIDDVSVTPHTGAVSTVLSGAGAAVPSTVLAGNPVLLTVAVTPAQT